MEEAESNYEYEDNDDEEPADDSSDEALDEDSEEENDDDPNAGKIWLILNLDFCVHMLFAST